ncbi:MAG: transposase [Candidatus Latescibacterota bacterium]
MFLGRRFQAFVDASPVSVMVRAVLERAFHADKIDDLFERTAEVQYTRELTFSTTVGLMSEVVLGVAPSIHAAYREAGETIPVSITSVYNKLNGVETAVSAELVRESARQLGAVIERMKGAAPELLPGYRVRILDGNHLSGTEHRIGELRSLRAGALPGQALAMLDPALMLVVEVVPCEDGHAQERSLVEEVLSRVQPADLHIDDRNFCTTRFLFGIHRRRGFFLTRQHGSTLQWELVGKRKCRGRTATGVVFEQTVHLHDATTGETLVARRITVELNEATRDGETEVHLLTNLPVEDAGAKQVANLYLHRWTIETMFQQLTVALRCEINTLGYPKAALFGFCLALVAYNAVSVVRAALRAVHGDAKVADEVSWHHLCHHISRVYGGMMIALPPDKWHIIRELSDAEFAELLKTLAGKINLRRFRKSRRGPKKPPPKKSSGAKIKHVSTARVLAKRKHH